jgi:hypothetical protein
MAIGFCLIDKSTEYYFDGKPVMLPQEFDEYVYQNENLLPFDVQTIIDIDPYGTTHLSVSEVKKLKTELENILKSALVITDEDREIIQNLIKFLNHAISLKSPVVSFGD